MTADKSVESLPCGFCYQEFEIDLRDAARPYKCPHCGEEAYLEAHRNPCQDPNWLALGMEMSEGARHELNRHSVCFHYRSPGEMKIASGTVVELGGRLLIATVSHAVPEDADRKLRFVPKHGGEVDLSRLKVKDFGFTDKNAPDVGFVELQAGQSFELLGIEPISLTRISDLGSGDPRRLGHLIGYPREYAVCDSSKEEVGILGLVYGFLPIAPEHWANAGPDIRDAICDRDVVITFEADERDLVRGIEQIPGLSSERPQPFGMSGGGLWQRPCPLDDDQIWTPDEACLFAIQYDWPRRGSFLRATQIAHWLKLVADYYDDLRDMLYDSYPRLRSMVS